VSSGNDFASRLARLSFILNDASARRHAPASDPVEQHLASLRLDRIQRLTREVEERTGLETDELDKVAMRLLLEEYASALVHLRAVAREGAKNVQAAPAALKDVRRFVEKQQARLAKRPASTAPSG